MCVWHSLWPLLALGFHWREQPLWQWQAWSVTTLAMAAALRPKHASGRCAATTELAGAGGCLTILLGAAPGTFQRHGPKRGRLPRPEAQALAVVKRSRPVSLLISVNPGLSPAFCLF